MNSPAERHRCHINVKSAKEQKRGYVPARDPFLEELEVESRILETEHEPVL
ncbi:MAG: hypothetical protein K0T01_1682 [Acidimicrobiia bacterium]|jgi:hypothetical protein|nr:hypothetical protein [Acidimicrobiia bacterium]